MFENMKAMVDGYEINSYTYLINSENWENNYKVVVGTGSAWCVTFYVNSASVEESIPTIIEFCESNDF